MEASVRRNFFEELEELLKRLSPPCRKAALQSQLTALERQELEAWMLSSKSSTHGHQAVRCPRPEKRSSRTRPSARRASGAAPAAPAATSSVVTFSQRTRRSGDTTWYYAVVCLPGLHILSRMRRQRALAVEDSKVLTATKRSVNEASRKGESFDQAVKDALALHSGSKAQSLRRRPKAGTAAVQPQQLRLRFYAAVELGGGFGTMLRAPCCYNLEDALIARRRLQEAVVVHDQGSLTTLPFSHCAELLERLRCAHRALYQEAAGTVAASDRAFGRVQRLVLQKREKSAWDQLRRLLRKRRAEVGDAPTMKGGSLKRRRFSENLMAVEDSKR